MGIDEAADEFVVAVGGEAIVFIEVWRDGLCVEAVEAENLFASGGILGGGVVAGERGNPLAEGASGGKAGVAVLEMEIGDVLVPAAEFFAGGGLARHGAEGFEEGVFAEVHEDGVGGAELVFVEGRVESDVRVGEFLEWRLGRG